MNFKEENYRKYPITMQMCGTFVHKSTIFQEKVVSSCMVWHAYQACSISVRSILESLSGALTFFDET